MFQTLKSILIGTILLYTILSCVDEPTIAPAASPFTQIRFGNLTNNIAGLDYYVEGVKVASDIQQNTFSEFKLYTSGARTFEVRITSTNEVLYSKNLSATSYEEISAYCVGHYSDNIDSTSFSFVSYTDGFTYIQEVVPDSIVNGAPVYIFHGVGATPSEIDLQFDISTLNMDDSTATEQKLTTSDGNFLKVTDAGGKTLTANNYSFTILGVDLGGNSDTLQVFNHELTSGMRNYIYLSGSPSDIKIGFEQVTPLEALDK